MRTAIFCLLLFSADAGAHYHMLIPDKSSVKTGEEVVVVYQFGHPFEHQLFDTTAPASATIYRPDGTADDVKASLKKIEVAGEKDKKVSAFQLTFKPEQRGDYTIVFNSPAVSIEGEAQPVFDTAKVVVHVQTQNGWDRQSAHNKGQAVDLVPLTRPYALRAGMLFRAVFHDVGGKRPDVPSPLGFMAVEIERYNAQPPKELPAEEHITYTARTDAKGVLATTLPDPGWWAVTAIKPSPNGNHRCIFWVHVDGKTP